MKNKQRTTNNEQRTHKAFTLIELMVAIGILVMVLSFASIIFRTSIDSQRTAVANAEIMRKLRAITDQLNADFQGLCKDGEIFVVWVAADPFDPNSERFDRIMFFANGDFQSYGTSPKIIQGNTARICYILANRPPANPGEPAIKPIDQKPEERILARTQHILTADDDPNLTYIFDPNNFSNDDWYEWNNWIEYDKTTLNEWKNMSRSNKQDMLTVIADVNVGLTYPPSTIPPESTCRGSTVDPADPNLIHMLLCEGVGQFKVQGWSWDDDQGKWRWVPEVDPNGDGILSDNESDFYPNYTSVPGLLYPYPPYGFVSINGVFYGNPYQELLNEERFDEIPGLGRALKFTFTLYDSKGVIKDGRTFTYIVYLD